MEDNVGYIEVLVTSQYFRKMIENGYKTLVNHKLITPIENLPDKRDIWETAKDFSKGRLSTEETVKIAHALLVFEYFLNQPDGGV